MRKRIKKASCPNCGHPLKEADNFCPECGQENHTHKLPLKEVALEFLESLFHFDTKLLRTLKDFFLKPGSVTKNFNENKRVRYVPPFRFYLFVSAIYFLALTSIHPIEVNRADGKGTNFTLKTDTADFSTAEGKDLKQLSEQKNVTMEDIRLHLEKHNKVATLKNILTTKVSVTLQRDKSGETLGYKILKNISYLMFLLMPLFAFLLYLVYRKKQIFYSEQLIFSVHYHTLAFMVLLLSLIVGLLFPARDPSDAALTVCIIYLFLSVKNVFAESWWKTLWKTILLLVVYFIIFLLALITAVAGSLLL